MPAEGDDTLASANVALITKTLIHSASRAIEEPENLDLAGFLDLCSLIDACVILDTVQTIASSDPLPDASLTRTLCEGKILAEFKPTISRDELNRVILRLPNEISSRLLNGSVDDQDADDPDRRDTVNQSGAVRGVDYSRNLAHLLIQIDSMPHYPSLRSPTPRERVFRSNGYLVVAAANGMDYFPDFDRVPFTMALVRKLYRSLPLEIYARVAESFDEQLGKAELISEWTLSAPLPIPPASAISLSRARTLDEVPMRVLEVRDEFAKYRQTFSEFKQSLHEADTLKRREQLQKRYRRLLEVASGEKPEVATVAEMTNLAELAIRAAAAPFIPTSYSASLLTQPVEWIRRWWLNRPLAILTRIDSKLPRVSEYNGMIEKLWGTHSSSIVTEQYSQHAFQVGRLMSERTRS